jgi:hypothetical protein
MARTKENPMKQKLVTKAIERKLDATPLYSTDGTPTEDKAVLVKFFNAGGAGTWIVFEAERLEGGDWRFFGLADLGQGCAELGYFHLGELQQVLGWRLERDQYGPARAFVVNGVLCEQAGA